MEIPLPTTYKKIKMKKTNICLIVMLMALSGIVNAQVNYLFSASSKPYVPVTGGTSPHLETNFTGWEAADEGYANIPIGFTFKYNNENYTQANVCVNGFITLGATSLDIIFPSGAILNGYPYFKNNLTYSPPYNKRPVIAPFWDDLVLPDTSNLVYKTTGAAPFRVFTIEWKQAKWVYESLGPVLSIELKLYETSNIIEFHYKDEGTLPDPRFAFASIGITSAWANRDFISLQNTSANPTISLLKSNDSLTVKPANNQVYKFTPAPINIPQPLESTLKYTNKKVSFKLQSNGVNSFEYAVTQSPIPPTSGKLTSSQNVTVSSLLPSTTYYIYARSRSCSTNFSQWTCNSVKTAVNPVCLPYIEDFENVSDPTYFPDNMRQQDFNDTSYYFSPLYPAFSTTQIFSDAGNSIYNNYFTDFYDLNAWAFTLGFNLKAGKTYQLKFSYGSFWSYDPSDPASLEVKYGKACGAAGMTSGLLFTNADITNADNLLDTVISFTPGSSGVYYFGFHDKSLYQKAALIFDNISLVEDLGLRLAVINDDATSNAITVYPNPAHEMLNVQTIADEEGNAKVIVTDVSGRILLTEQMQLKEGINNFQVSVADLPPSFYFIKLVTENGTINKTIKFIKE